MKYCTRCLNVSTRPNIVMQDNGLCPPCHYYHSPDEIDWDQRKNELNDLIEFAQKNSSSGFDCIVGVSGGKDSTRQALWVKERFGLNPLLVSMNYPPEQVSQRGVDNLSNLISHGFTCINISCSPQIWRKAMKHSFINYGNWLKSTEFALFASVPRLAVAYQIPLIWWGENAALVLGDLGVKGKHASDGNRLKYSNTLQGGNPDWLLEAGIRKEQILQYLYPSDQEMQSANLRIVFIDYFLNEFSHLQNGNFSALRGLHIRKANPLKNPEFYGTAMLDEDFISINMYIRYLKFGFGRATDLVNEEIRYGRMSRAEAIRLVEDYDRSFDLDVMEKFCAYIEISTQEFWQVVDRFVNKDLFSRLAEGVYKPKFKVGFGA